jgi:cytochrome c oxidase assembly protein subunit 11
VAFVIDPKLPKDVTTITLSYTFFEVGGKVPAAPQEAVQISTMVSSRMALPSPNLLGAI